MKMSSMEAVQSILSLLNKMNIALTKSIVKLTENKSVEIEVLENMNAVMNGVTGLTSIYNEAHRQLSEQNKVTSDSEESAKMTAKMQAAAAIVNEGKEKITKAIGNAVNGIASIVEESNTDTNNVSKETLPTNFEGKLNELIGENGLFFRNLSPDVHSFGKGTIKPSKRFPAFVENIFDIPVNDLADYPEGFYCTFNGKCHQLFLRFGPMSYLWLFSQENRELFILNNGDWISIFNIPQTSVKMITGMLDVHFKTCHLDV